MPDRPPDVGRHVNHRGWIVVRSVQSHDGARCVDLFEDPAGGFGFEEFRSDVEDGGRWTPIGGYASARYCDLAHATRRAIESVAWLAETHRKELSER